MWNACARSSGNASGSVVIFAHLVIGATIETMSVSWNPPCRPRPSSRSSCRLTCPVMKTTGTESK